MMVTLVAFEEGKWRLGVRGERETLPVYSLVHFELCSMGVSYLYLNTLGFNWPDTSSHGEPMLAPSLISAHEPFLSQSTRIDLRCADEETEAQRRQVTCPKSHNQASSSAVQHPVAQ